MSHLTVGPGTEVVLHFSLAFESGEVIDSNFDKNPATFVFGDGQLLPGFENALVGLSPKNQASFVIPPEDAFGLRKEENIKHVNKRAFAADEKIEKGMVYGFKDASGGEVPGVIMDVGDTLVVDFNHPLAGRSIVFAVQILDIKSST